MVMKVLVTILVTLKVGNSKKRLSEKRGAGVTLAVNKHNIKSNIARDLTRNE